MNTPNQPDVVRQYNEQMQKAHNLNRWTSQLRTERLGRDTTRRLGAANASLYDPNSNQNIGASMAPRSPGVNELMQASLTNPYGTQDQFGILTRGGVSTPMTQMNGGDLRTAEMRRRAATEAQRKQQATATSGRLSKEYDAAMVANGLKPPSPVMGAASNAVNSVQLKQNYDEARQRRKDDKALGKARQFARAQMRSGYMFNPDGTADLTGSMAAQLMNRRPDIAALLATGRDQTGLQRSKFDALVDQQEVDNQYRTSRDTVLDGRYDDTFEYQQGRDLVGDEQANRRIGLDETRTEAEVAFRRDQTDLERSKFDALVDQQEADNQYRTSRDTVLDGRYDDTFEYQQGRDLVGDEQANRRIGLDETRTEAEVARAAAEDQMRADALALQREQAGYANTIAEGELGLATNRDKREQDIHEQNLGDDDEPRENAERVSQFLTDDKTVQQSMYDTLMSKPPEEQQAYIDAVGMPLSYIEEMANSTNWFDHRFPLYGAPLDLQQRRRRKTAAEQLLETFGKPARYDERYQ